MTKQIEDMTVNELKAEAKALGLKGYSKMVKSELVRLIRENQETVEDIPETAPESKEDNIVRVPFRNRHERRRAEKFARIPESKFRRYA